jgi:copper chaperone
MNQTFQVQGMTCGHCEKAVAQAVWSIDDKAQVQIDRPNGVVKVQSDAAHEAIAKAIADEGYRVQGTSAPV